MILLKVVAAGPLAAVLTSIVGAVAVPLHVILLLCWLCFCRILPRTKNLTKLAVFFPDGWSNRDCSCFYAENALLSGILHLPNLQVRLIGPTCGGLVAAWLGGRLLLFLTGAPQVLLNSVFSCHLVCAASSWSGKWLKRDQSQSL